MAFDWPEWELPEQKYGYQRALAECLASTGPDALGALVDRLLGRAGVTPGDRVADFGAGTGLLTGELLARDLPLVFGDRSKRRGHFAAPRRGRAFGRKNSPQS